MALASGSTRGSGVGRERFPLQLDGDAPPQHGDGDDEPLGAFLAHDHAEITPERAFPNPNGVARAKPRERNQRGAGFLQGVELSEFQVEQILVRNVQKADDDPAVSCGGAALGLPAKKDIPRKKRNVADEFSPAPAGPPFPDREVERDPERAKVPSQRLFCPALHVGDTPGKLRDGQPEKIVGKVVCLALEQRHRSSIATDRAPAPKGQRNRLRFRQPRNRISSRK